MSIADITKGIGSKVSSMAISANDSIVENYLNPDSAQDTALSKWLDTTLAAPLAHWGIIALGQKLLGSHTQTGHNLLGTLGVRTSSMTSLIASSVVDPTVGTEALFGAPRTLDPINALLVKTAELMNYLYEILRDPNIEGIPIHTATLSVSREVDVSDKPVIMQTAQNKAYVQDNATPRPCRWSIDGYLTATSMIIDSLSIIKPTLIAQQQYLDFIAKSRRPAWFKDQNCAFHLVLITSLNIESTATTNNGVHVTCQLTEYVPLQVSTSAFTDTIMSVAGNNEFQAPVDMAEYTNSVAPQYRPPSLAGGSSR